MSRLWSPAATRLPETLSYQKSARSNRCRRSVRQPGCSIQLYLRLRKIIERKKRNTSSMQAITKLVTHGRTELAKVIVGQSELIDGTLTALLCGGHALIEGVPGLGKTL